MPKRVHSAVLRRGAHPPHCGTCDRCRALCAAAVRAAVAGEPLWKSEAPPWRGKEIRTRKVVTRKRPGARRSTATHVRLVQRHGRREHGPPSLSTTMYASVQIGEITLGTRLVLIPRDTVDVCRRSSLQSIEGPTEQVKGDVVQQCREPNSFVPSCSLTYAVQRGGYAFPTLRLARAAPVRIALGPAPSLHRGCRRMTRGRCDWLDLQRAELPSATTCRISRRTENVSFQFLSLRHYAGLRCNSRLFA